MMSDLKAILWKEWRETILQHGSVAKWVASIALIIGVLGVFLPLQLGKTTVESVSLLLWMWMPLFLVVNSIADSIAGERERHTLETLLASRLPDSVILMGKLIVPIAQAWVTMLVVAVVTFITVNLMTDEGRIIMYPIPVVVGVIILPIIGGLLVAGIGIIVSAHATTVRQAYQRMIVAVFGIILLPIMGLSFLPSDITAQFYSPEFAETALSNIILLMTVVISLLDMLILTYVFRRFHRARLISD